jgi:GT2 family glycosyltransferase
MKSAIIILHYRNWDNTLKCIKSLLKQDKSRNKFDIFLIDNDDVKSQNIPNFAKYRVKINYIQTKKNLGFAKGINFGLKIAYKNKSYSNFLILNNDVILSNNTMNALIETKPGISSPVIRFNWNDKLVYDYGGFVHKWTGRTYHMEKDYFDKTSKYLFPDFVSGCCMFINRKIIDSIGFFDEKYFFYFEDVDYCIRVKSIGHCVTVTTDTIIDHLQSASIGKWSNKAILYNLKGNFRFISTHMGKRKFIGYIYLISLIIKIVYNRIFRNL